MERQSYFILQAWQINQLVFKSLNSKILQHFSFLIYAVLQDSETEKKTAVQSPVNNWYAHMHLGQWMLFRIYAGVKNID